MSRNKLTVNGQQSTVTLLKKSLFLLIIPILLLSGCARKTPERLLQDADQAFQQMDFTNAIIKLEDFLERYPNDPRAINAQYGIARSYAYQRNFDKSIEEFQKVMKTYPAQHELVTQAQFDIANCYVAKEDWNKATEVWETIARDTSNPMAVVIAKLNVAKVYEDKNEWKKAEEYYRDILQSLPLGGKYPPQASVQYELDVIQKIAHTLYKQDKIKDSIATYQSLQKKYPDDEYAQGVAIWSNVLIGLVYDTTKQPQKAKEYYNKAMVAYAKITTDKLMPDKAAWAATRMGEIYEFYIHDTAKAVAIYQETVKNYANTKTVQFAQNALMRITQSTTSRDTTLKLPPVFSQDTAKKK